MMPATRFQDIAVVGSGSLTLQVADYLNSLGRRLTLVEIPEVSRFSLRRRAQDRGIDVETVSKRDMPEFIAARAAKASQLAEEMVSSAYKPLLVLSVENMYLFPASVVENPLVEIINYHNSLLPRHRGMNAEAWAIFDEDRKAGFTWHLIDNDIDTGSIIYQESFDLTSQDTSLGLLSKCSRRAFGAFTEFFGRYERGEISPLAQELRIDTGCCSHHAGDRPNGGYLDAGWCLARMSAFLRSFDYGKLRELGQPLLRLDGTTYTWRSYSIQTDSPEPSRCCMSGSIGADSCGRGCTHEVDLEARCITFAEKDFGAIVLKGVRACEPQCDPATTQTRKP